MKAPPGFTMFVEDFLGSSRIAGLTDNEFRAYVMLLLRCWALGCTLPSTLPELSRLASVEVTEKVKSFFETHPKVADSITHPKLLRQLQFRQQAAESGSRGGKRSKELHPRLNPPIRMGGSLGGSMGPLPSFLEDDVHQSTDEHPASGENGEALNGSNGTTHGPRLSAPRVDYPAFMRRWNSELAPALKAQPIDEISKTERKKLAARLREVPDFPERILRVAPNLNSFAREGWLTFNWLIKNDTNLIKLIRGDYAEKRTDAQSKNAHRSPFNDPNKFEHVKETILRTQS